MMPCITHRRRFYALASMVAALLFSAVASSEEPTSQEWRPWSSPAIRLSSENNGIQLGMDYMTARWNGGGFETTFFLPREGKSYTWRTTYDPDATPPREWPDPSLNTPPGPMVEWDGLR